jgi:cytochrome c peroxidase
MNRTTLLFILLLVTTALTLKEKLFEKPGHFPEPSYNFRRNPLSEAKIALGRELFYDAILSADNSVSCASCHSPSGAFSHADQVFSRGINDSIGFRNAPALFNLAWQTSFMWDGAIDDLDRQALAPLTHPGEMGADMSAVPGKLQKSQKYRQLFANAYGDGKITEERVLKALSQFELTLVSAGSKYDEWQLGRAELTREELAGYDIFLENCNNCHSEPLFTNDAFADIALPHNSAAPDHGRWTITGDPADSMLFRVPSLRNLSYTFPYMHDGRFRTLKEVVDYYEDNRERAVDNRMRYMRALTPTERAELMAFLRTLDDPGFVVNPKFSRPEIK